MKVKIGDVYHDSDKEPIMVTLSDDEKNLIATMPGKNFCSYPTTQLSIDVVRLWMKKGYEVEMGEPLVFPDEVKETPSAPR